MVVEGDISTRSRNSLRDHIPSLDEIFGGDIDDASTLNIDRSNLPDIELLREWARERLDALYTEQGRRLGESRWDFMKSFFEQFALETNTGAEE